MVHKRLSWTVVDQSSERSAIDWLCVDIDGCKFVNVYKPPASQLTLTAIPVFPYPVFMRVILTASTVT